MTAFGDQRFALIAFVAVIALCLALSALMPMISGSEAGKKRALNAVRRSPDSRGAEAKSRVEAARRRKMIAETVKDIGVEKRQKSASLDERLEQAGLSVSSQTFVGAFVLLGSFIGIIAYLFINDMLIACGFAAITGVATPIWLLQYLQKRRIEKFILGFPLALDTIVRGVRSGLPLGDCLSVIANEAAEPVRGEFRRMAEAQAVGLSIGEAAERIAERIPIPETTFFSIILGIQQSSGGNIGESLANLSDVLRDRKKMRDKVSALTTEGIVSAAIIGSMPFLVVGGLYLIQPDFISVLFTTDKGLKILGVVGAWMMIGVVIMKKMINFDV